MDSNQPINAWIVEYGTGKFLWEGHVPNTASHTWFNDISLPNGIRNREWLGDIESWAEHSATVKGLTV